MNPNSPRGAADLQHSPTTASVRRSDTSESSIPTAVNSAWPSSDKLDSMSHDEKDEVATLPTPSPVPGRRSSLTRTASRLSRASTKTQRMTGVQATQIEMMLRVQTRESGVHSHAGGEGRGVVEKPTVLDMGDGPEEVVVIDWAPGDPEVSRVRRRSEFRVVAVGESHYTGAECNARRTWPPSCDDLRMRRQHDLKWLAEGIWLLKSYVPLVESDAVLAIQRRLHECGRFVNACGRR